MAIKFDMDDHTWIVGVEHQVSIVKCMVSQHYLDVVTLSGSNLKGPDMMQVTAKMF